MESEKSGALSLTFLIDNKSFNFCLKLEQFVRLLAPAPIIDVK